MQETILKFNSGNHLCDCMPPEVLLPARGSISVNQTESNRSPANQVIFVAFYDS